MRGALQVLLLGATLIGGRSWSWSLPSDHTEVDSTVTEVRAHCVYPCRCGIRPSCPPGVPLVRDGCGCCLLCAGQRGDYCDGARICDEARGIVCQYSGSSPTGICRAIKGKPCHVDNETYDNGETFMLDCRTQCACQNGTYACASLCPQESISPRGFSCAHPRLVELPGQCCREWMCDSDAVEKPPECPHVPAVWSQCSRSCGLGLSARLSNQNPGCVLMNQTRLCQLRPCSEPLDQRLGNLHVKIRRGHECKATLRAAGPARLRLGRCVSKRHFRPKHCGDCRSRGLCCTPRLSSSVKVEFECEGDAPVDPAALEDLGTYLGADLWVPGLSNPEASVAENKVSDEEDSAQEHNAGAIPEEEEDPDQGDLEEEEEEDVEGENEEGHRFSKGRLWSVFGAPRKRKQTKSSTKSRKTSVFYDLQWITKCECSRCPDLSENGNEHTHIKNTIASTQGDVILHRVHRTTVL